MGVRLDRCLINLDWRLKFQEGVVVHLGWLKSDQRPILLRLENQTRRKQHKRPVLKLFGPYMMTS